MSKHVLGIGMCSSFSCYRPPSWKRTPTRHPGVQRSWLSDLAVRGVALAVGGDAAKELVHAFQLHHPRRCSGSTVGAPRAGERACSSPCWFVSNARIHPWSDSKRYQKVLPGYNLSHPPLSPKKRDQTVRRLAPVSHTHTEQLLSGALRVLKHDAQDLRGVDLHHPTRRVSVLRSLRDHHDATERSLRKKEEEARPWWDQVHRCRPNRSASSNKERGQHAEFGRNGAVFLAHRARSALL